MPPRRRLVLSIPGLSRSLLPHIPPGSRFATFANSLHSAHLTPSWPAVTCSVQASLTTGVPPSAHGIIANGLPTYLGDQALTDPQNLTDYRQAVSFWEQSNQLLDAPRIWAGKSLKTALLFFQNSMPGFAGELKPAADIVLTPKPEHGPHGRLTSLLWSNPPGLAKDLQTVLGPFPLMNYWGPMANLKSSQWIIAAAAKVWTDEAPDLQLTYIPHLDYDLQRFGPGSSQAAQAVADLAQALEPSMAAAEGHDLLIFSEYAIDEVSRAIAPNRALLEAGFLRLTENAEGPLIHYGASAAWVLCDHQIGHVYVSKNAELPAIRDVLLSLGLEILSPTGDARPIAHRRAGNLQVQAPKGAWLDYRWWRGAQEAPSWAATVDIHRKPGYDPLELFFNPQTKTIISDAAQIRGSHGRIDGTPALVLSTNPLPARLTAPELASLLLP